MAVEYVSGDLFLSRAQTLAHGVNCAGKMGAGIAKEFKKQFPAMFQRYKQLCRTNQLKPAASSSGRTTIRGS